jgi:hypothetical protein
MQDEKVTTQVEPVNADEKTETTDTSGDEGEFKITVKKLDMPVRPRGVLAE